ncbi:MAG: SAM-dependent chlorinase/fluorinase [Anaerolineae bacterium]|nr:SAM-dependent chlorinase/fluorinase [Anaerolineae bacterium]
MQIPYPIITLLTDFGERDAYVGAMKGVILSIVPGAQMVDISHQVAPQNIYQAATILAGMYAYYPSHTIHLAVVDPGVGTRRQPIALETPHGIFVAPDNGILTLVRLQEPSSTPVLLENSAYWLSSPGSTFHGRDIFSPVAAHLARGVPVREMGAVLDTLVMLPLDPIEITPTAIRGKVVYIDHFGNLITNIRLLSWSSSDNLERDTLQIQSGTANPIRFQAATARVTGGWHVIRGIHQTYGMVEDGQAVATVGSNGELEIAINQGNASDILAIRVNDPITLHLD